MVPAHYRYGMTFSASNIVTVSMPAYTCPPYDQELIALSIDETIAPVLRLTYRRLVILQDDHMSQPNFDSH
jgi:hypothetical protein